MRLKPLILSPTIINESKIKDVKINIPKIIDDLGSIPLEKDYPKGLKITKSEIVDEKDNEGNFVNSALILTVNDQNWDGSLGILRQFPIKRHLEGYSSWSGGYFVDSFYYKIVIYSKPGEKFI